jgi:hypothetical protein
MVPNRVVEGDRHKVKQNNALDAPRVTGSKSGLVQSLTADQTVRPGASCWFPQSEGYFAVSSSRRAMETCQRQ